jgi:hypothetical protein
VRLAGHSLINEGAAFKDDPTLRSKSRRVIWNTTSGVGFGLCSCGARSPILDSANMRKAWHRNHKDNVAIHRAAEATGMSR